MTALEAVKKHGSINNAAKALGVARSTLQARVKKEKAICLPMFPPGQASAPAIIRKLAAEARTKKDRLTAEKWFPIRMRTPEPIGILWFGDPHLGTSTNWDRLESDVALCASSPGLYGANIGDTTNNWTGRLTRLYADEDISRKTERKLAKWFLAEAGITWLAWIMGNHDEWEHGADILRLMDVHNRVPMLDWSARFEIQFPKAPSVRVHASHDFPGHSMWNITHGPARAPRFNGSDADLYVCGHRHDWGIQQFEIAERGKTPLAIRVRGYKTADPYARRHGFQEAEHGASILTIIDPNAAPAGRVTAFVDVQQGARVLKALRGGK